METLPNIQQICEYSLPNEQRFIEVYNAHQGERYYSFYYTPIPNNKGLDGGIFSVRYISGEENNYPNKIMDANFVVKNLFSENTDLVVQISTPEYAHIFLHSTIICKTDNLHSHNELKIISANRLNTFYITEFYTNGSYVQKITTSPHLLQNKEKNLIIDISEETAKHWLNQAYKIAFDLMNRGLIDTRWQQEAGV